ncbi:helix-turn-helix domain-containing protein [Cupriavidus pauculus]|uniref:Helix-turn-helix domain-containing protein n=1 Tax=Cupriavidus pauculus TaxID=82633 RepID=A0A5P2H0B2_9BURK|nr:RodZ domain-containing protein [Cupriavidus pauculus]QET01266.1 helix-turn-helix domain-containing protein [Cupriavidus pauculus]
MSEQERAESQTASGVVETDRDAVAREIGAQLKAGREAQRLSLEDVSARLKVAATKLAAIESGNVSSLPDVTFAKGVMRAYARTLHIDIDPLLGRYHAQAQTTPVAEITRRHEGSLNQTFDDRNRFGSSNRFGSGGSASSGGRWVWLFFVVAVLGAGGWFGYDHAKAWLEARHQQNEHAAETAATDEATPQSSGDGTVTAALPPVMTGNDSPAPSEAPAITAPAPATAGTATTATATTASGMPLATGGALTAPTAPGATETPAASAPAAAVAATAAAAAAAAAGGDVELRFSADTWYEVRDRNGKVVLGGTAKAGDVVTGGGAAPYKLVIGNVKGVESVRRNGAPVDFKSADRNNVARLTLP